MIAGPKAEGFALSYFGSLWMDSICIDGYRSKPVADLREQFTLLCFVVNDCHLGVPRFYAFMNSKFGIGPM